MTDVWDIIGALTGGQTPATALGPQAALGPIAPVAGPALAPAMQGLAQWANVPGPPQSIGDVFDRLGRVLHAANTLGGAAGMIATQPYFARQAQIANAPGLANLPVPWLAGMAGTSLAIPSLLPGGQQIAESLGIAPPTGYGDVIGPAYQASAEQSGGLAGLGAALDKLAETYAATPETVPLTKFVGENVSNPINYLGTIARAPGIIGQAGTATQEALNLPFRGVKAGITHIPYFSDLSDRAKAVLYSQAFQDLQRNVTAGVGELGLPVPESLGKGAAGDVRGLGLQAMRGATAQDAELAAEAAAKATANANAAKANLADRLAGGAGVSEAPAVVPTAEAAGAAAAAGAPEAGLGAVPGAAEAVAAGPAHTLNWLNNRAQGSYRFAEEATNAAPGVPPHLPGMDIPLDIVRKALDPADQADDWLGAVLANIRTEGVRSGQVVEEAAKAQRRRGYQRGGGPGLVSERTGPLLFEPDTVHQVSDVVLRLQDLTKRGQPGGLPLGEDVRLATGVRWMEQFQYGDTFPVPPPGEKGYYWAAIQRHMETLGELPKPTEPTVPPPGGLPSPAPAAGGAIPEAAPRPGEVPLTPPEPAPPSAVPGAAAPPAGGAENLGAMFGSLGRAMSGQLVDELWHATQAGETVLKGQPNAILQAAKLLRDEGRLQTRADVEQLARQVAPLDRTGPTFQQDMQALVRDFQPGGAPPPAGGALPLEGMPPTPAPPAGLPRPGAPPAGLPSGPPEAVPGIGLPRTLAKGSPRYGYGGTNYELSFADDIDKALYIVGNATTRSKADAQYLGFLQQALPGATEAELRDWGGQVRNVIKGMAREAGPDEALLEIPQTYTGLRTAAPAAPPLYMEGTPARTTFPPPPGTVREPPLAPQPWPGSQLSPEVELELQAQEQYLQREIRRLTIDDPAAAVPDVVVDPLRARLAAIQTLRQGPPVARGEIPPAPPPFEPPSLQPQGPLGGVAEVPPAPFEAGTTMRQDPAVMQELVDALKSRDIISKEGPPEEMIAANRRVADAQTAADAELLGAMPTREQVVAGELAPHIASARATIGRFTTPAQAPDVAAYGERLNTTLDKFFPAVDRARELRTAAGLGEEASLRDTINTLKQQGSDLTGEAQQLQKDWRSDLLSGDWENIVHQNVLKAEMKARGLDPDKFAGPAWMRSMTDAWRAQALLSSAFHVKNVADSVIKSYLDSGSPGFLAGAKPWQPDDLAALIKAAWRDTAPAVNPNAALSPQVRVWGAIHELPVFDTMFAAQNPTLTQALKALPREDYENVLKQLSPIERELMRLDPTLGVPSAIKESIGPLEAGGFLSKIPFVDRVLAMNLKLTMGIEQSARGAKFINSYDDFIKQGMPQGEAYQQAIGEANRLFFDYQGGLTNADVIFRHVFGFHTFASRNINYYAPVLASNPILIQALKGWEDYSNQMAEEGGYAANRRFAESMKIPMVGGLGGGIAQLLFGRQGQLFWNPAVYFSIAEQTMSTPQEYRDEPLLGQVLGKARTFGAGLAPWVDIPLEMAGAYGARGPQSVTSLDSLLESAFQTATGRPGELPWKTVQRLRLPGQATPAALDIGVRQRLGEMSLEERPDFAQISPGQPIHPDFVRAMAEGPGNPLYEEAARDVGRERLAGVALGKVTGGGPGFQSVTAGRMAEALGNQPKDLTKLGRQQYLAGRMQALAPEDLPLLTARREIGMKTLNEPGAQPAGEPPESPQAYVARVWPSASPARQWALLQTQDPALKEAISAYLGSRIHLGR